MNILFIFYSYEFAHKIFPCIKNLCLVTPKNFNKIKKRLSTKESLPLIECFYNKT